MSANRPKAACVALSRLAVAGRGLSR
jgi:hypothetical protein